MAVWYSLWSLGILFPFWYVSTNKTPATLRNTLSADAQQKHDNLLDSTLKHD
jgi:hypothetical protein